RFTEPAGSPTCEEALSNGTNALPTTRNFDTLTRRAYLLCAIIITLLSCSINVAGITNTEVIDDHDLLHNIGARGCGRNPVDCFRHPQFGLYYRPLMGVSFSIGENLHGQRPLP